jgi:uncharacterized membrane protein
MAIVLAGLSFTVAIAIAASSDDYGDGLQSFAYFLIAIACSIFFFYIAAS